MKTYFFVLGTHLKLSLAELDSLLDIKKAQLIDNIFVVKLDKNLELTNFIKKIGGTIKAGIIEKAITETGSEFALINNILNIIKNELSNKPKIIFGFSSFGKPLPVSKLAMRLKKELKKENIKSRWIQGREKNLSSVIITQNKMIDGKKEKKGIEIILIKTNNKIFIGYTQTAQDFKGLSFRDYGRPARDSRSGMLPPKLAQIMINLTKTKSSDKILDPFCGSGTILTEAILAGYKNIIGADISQKAIEDTKKNIKWIQKQFKINIKPTLLYTDARQLSKQIQTNSIDAIVTEPFLGPQRGHINIKKVVTELEELYSRGLKEFYKILKPNKKVVMVWPIIQGYSIKPRLNGFKIINPFSANLSQKIKLNKKTKFGLIYGRTGQKVQRRIVVLQKAP